MPTKEALVHTSTVEMRHDMHKTPAMLSIGTQCKRRGHAVANNPARVMFTHILVIVIVRVIVLVLVIIFVRVIVLLRVLIHRNHSRTRDRTRNLNRTRNANTNNN